MKFWSQADKPLKYGHCVRLSISNAVQREISEESAAEALKILNKKIKGKKKIFHGNKHCQLEKIHVISKVKQSIIFRTDACVPVFSASKSAIFLPVLPYGTFYVKFS